MDGIMQADDDIKKEPISPKPLPEISSAVVNINKEQVEAPPKSSNVQISTINGNNQVLVSAGNKIVPIRGILLKPVTSAGTTTLISVPVSLTSNGTHIQTVPTKNATMAEKEKPPIDNVILKPAGTRGVSKVCEFLLGTSILYFFISVLCNQICNHEKSCVQKHTDFQVFA